MKVLKIKLNQVFANYRKPMSYNYIDTFPLPPFSTIKGWFHNVIEAKEYHSVSMSVQGTNSSVIQDMQTMIKFDKKRKEKEQIIVEDFKRAFSKSPIYVANIFNIDLNIYLLAKESLLEQFKEKVFQKSFPSLGRYEDLARIDFVDFVELDKKSFFHRGDNRHNISYGIYLTKDCANNANLSGINYRLPFKYENTKENDGLRVFKEKIDTVFIDNGSIKDGTFLYDSKDNRIIELIGDYSFE